MRGSAVFRTGVAPGGALAGPWVRNPLWTRARAVPSLDLRFADNKSLVDAVTGAQLVTFTRASSGTFVGSDGLIKTATTNEPRFDHNPTTGESLGLLVEEARTNLVLRSEEFDDVAWTKTNSTITANTVVSPDGLTTGDSITSSAGLLGSVVQAISQTTGTAYTFSAFAKADQYTFCQLRITGTVVGTITRAYFNLTTGTITGTVNCTASITPVGNGWYRCSITYTTILTATASPRVYGQVDAADTVGDGTSGIYIWGAQMEAGAFPTSYIPTTTATVTRAADVASITGSNFSSWYNQAEGTVFAEFTAAAYNTASLAISDGTNNNRIMIDRGSTGTRYIITNAGVSQSGGAQTPYTLNSFAKASIGFALDNCNLAVNGLTQTVDTSVSIPSTVDRLLLGVNASASGYGNGPIKRVTFWPIRPADSTLQTITQ